MAYASWSVVFGEQPSAAKWNILGTNDASFNDGTGIGTAAIAPASLGRTVVSAAGTNITATGNNVITGVGFQPRVIQIIAGLASNGSNATTSNGTYDRIGGTQGCVATNAATGAFSSRSSTTLVIDVEAPSATVHASGTISATSADGFTLNIGTASATAVAWRWIAFA